MYDCIYSIWIYANICQDMQRQAKYTSCQIFFRSFEGSSEIFRELPLQVVLEHRWWNDQPSTICDQTWSWWRYEISIQGVTVWIFWVLVNLSMSTQPCDFFFGGTKPSAETTRSWGSHHGVDSDFGAYEGAHASWMPIRWMDDGPNLGEVLEDHLKITWPQHNQLKTMELISNVDGWTSYESRTLAGISSIADSDSDEWRLQEWPNPGKRAWWNMVN